MQHAIERAKERYGIDLTIAEVEHMSQRLKPFSMKQPGTVSEEGDIKVISRLDRIFPPRVHIAVQHNNMWLYVGYNPVDDIVATLLHPRSYEKKSK